MFILLARHATGISLARRDPLRGLDDQPERYEVSQLPSCLELLPSFYACSLTDDKLLDILLLVSMCGYGACNI